MASLEGASISDEPTSSPRISFSSEFLDEKNFISITPNAQAEKERKDQQERARSAAEFEFLSSKLTNENMITADELFFEGKLRPYWQMHYAEKLNKISLKTEGEILNEAEVKKSQEETRPINWFIDEDPSPRPPKCTVLWKELLRLKQKRASSLSPSSSTSSSSSSGSLADISVAPDQEKSEKNKGQATKEKHVKRIKKGLERSRSETLRVRPVIHVPICTQGKNTALPPLFSIKKKGRAIER
ncbi:hypothetical protein CQW23_22273 [Capsicum baccatum]|uniref:Uncharacterized protein n=2 Tax=Capsicum TaxID=4071 RepID=A0A1U8FCN7_CAPAN|nr:uncharacterized protein LOC107856524 [Capsicum annuum]PHT38700.1 hypothetical protein CQW23_22273 [Capsicum baccatum]PHU21910.1 hypothetical protein BC332_07017 [Capsicum chinense]KAF3662986.1 putative carboxylesterase 13-like [Capsicum annuum]KAF3677930.1 putative carboxylesterase 13-like [Capsicum annuum]PHT86035.1 hypothetical protein T459_08141 [Capsicum annuum]